MAPEVNTAKREVAWRVFAREFNSATTVIPGEDQFAPSYVLSPLGAMINRIFLTGVLTECENIGTELEPLWRGRVSDPTDVFFISAGQFQPKAARYLADIEVPSLIAITGKARTYSPDENTMYVSVRVENVKQITQELRDYWVLEACQSMQYRLKAISDAMQMDSPNVKELISLGYSKKISNGIIEAINHFGKIDIQSFYSLYSNVLSELSMETSMDVTVLKTPGIKSDLTHSFEKTISGSETTSDNVTLPPTLSISVTAHQVQNIDQDETTDGEKKIDAEISEDIVLEIINSLADESPEGVVYDEIKIRAGEQGLKNDIIEECIGSLIDKGVIYEPSIGVFKSV